MSPLHFGVLMIPYQALDAVGPLDILQSCSKETVTALSAGGFPGLDGMASKAIDITYHHINTTMEAVTLSAGITILPTSTCDTCPPLDILLIGGPEPYSFNLDERFAAFVRAHVEAGKTLFTTCTGAWAIAGTGLLDGKRATTNHALIDLAVQQYPKVAWTREKRWVVDGNLWTAGGACAGMDMVAHWVVENYGTDVARMAFFGLDYEPRDVDGKAAAVIPPLHGGVAS